MTADSKADCFNQSNTIYLISNIHVLLQKVYQKLFIKSNICPVSVTWWKNNYELIFTIQRSGETTYSMVVNSRYKKLDIDFHFFVVVQYSLPSNYSQGMLYWQWILVINNIK